MSWLLKLLSPFLGYIAAAGGILLAIFTFGALKKREGRREAERVNLEKAAEIQQKQSQVKKPDPEKIDDVLDRL